MDRQRITAVLRLDALANAAGGAILLAAGGWLAPHAGLGTAWPIYLAGALLLGFGLENGVVSRRPTPSRVAGLIAVDLAFAVAMLVLVVSNPTDGAVWVTAALGAAGVMSLGFAIAKEIGRRSLVGSNLRSTSKRLESPSIRSH